MSSEERMREWAAAQALEWFVAHRSDELTDAKRAEFMDWLRASPANVREYLALTGFSEDVRRVVANLPVSAESLLEQARADLTTVQPLFPHPELAPAGHESAPLPAEKSLRTWLAAAAIILGAVALGFFTMWRVQAPPDYSTAHAEQRSWRMPDGSTVHLNSGTQIKVRFSNERREVELIQGQALFQVAKDARRPFWVRTGDAAVKAVGTEFDVYRQSRRTIVSVVEGRVAVWPLQGTHANQTANALGAARANAVSGEPVAQVDAGQQARISGETAVVSTKADEVRKTVAWLQRQVVFDHDPLGTAVEEFNRYSELRIRIADPALSTAEVSGIFSAYDAEAFIRFLEHQPDMQVERTEREVIVSTKAAL